MVPDVIVSPRTGQLFELGDYLIIKDRLFDVLSILCEDLADDKLDVWHFIVRCFEEEDLQKPLYDVATFGAGCFWCVEAVLQQIPGVVSVTSGYMGGHVKDPTYRQICQGDTGHAEVVQVTFDPKVISYADLLDWFWKLHDPTTIDQQGNDIGPQYRSAIFFHS